MLKPEDLRDKLVEAISSGTFPGSAVKLSLAIKSYVEANGQAISPTISYTLAPCSGIGWEELIPLASSTGVADSIISVAVNTEFASSMKVIPGPSGVETVPMVFNTSAKVGDMSQLTDFKEVWLEIAKAIVDFFSTEIK